MSEFANLDQVVTSALTAWKPPPRLTLSEWADRFFYLSSESAAEPGRWKTLPYQKGVLDAITDPTVEQVSVMKSARVGYTKCMNAAIGYFIHQDPSSMLVVQPTVDDAKGYSKEEIAPMLRDCPELARVIFEDAEEIGPKDSGNTILHKKYPGGVLSMVGANSGAGFRRISRRVVIFDEVDGYPPSAGSDGDQIKLGIKRTEFFWNRKIIAGSTPLVAGGSRIERLFEEGDQRFYFVPCPHCAHMDKLVFHEPDTTKGQHGHWMHWEEDRPETAHFICFQCGSEIEHKDKRAMVAAGEWRASQPFEGHASFHIWTAYSFAPNATWGQLAEEFLRAKHDGAETLKTFVNTVLGETWKERGDAPDWQRLYHRREPYQIGSVPDPVRFLTAGVDVQKDRWVFEIVGWGEGKRSWSIESGVIPGDTSNDAEWARLDDLLNRTWRTSAGTAIALKMLAVDSGYNTQMVYNWARRHVGRVIATKGQSTAKTLLGAPTAVDVTVRGKRIARGCKVWPVGVDIAKAELYGWLRLERPTGDDPYPSGFCHFPEYGEAYFKQLTAEHLISSVKRTGFVQYEWQLIPGRENHFLDCRVYARAAAGLAGLDRMRTPSVQTPPVATTVAPVVTPMPAPVKPAPVARTDSRFLSRPGRGKPWLG
jgi:phage terminase large subunit GpA-like protein